MQPKNNRSLSIGMILDGSYPKDIRVRKEAESLAKHHSVFVLCCKSEGEKEYEEINGVKVVRAISYKSNFEKGLIDMILSVNFIHPYFSKQIGGFIQEYSLDVVHTHDLPLAKTVQRISRKYNVQTVLDLHENYAAALSTWFLWRKSTLIRLKNKIFFNYKRWSKYERKYLPKYDKIIAVVEEMKERLLEDNPLESEKIVVITNSEKKDFVKHFESKDDNFFSKGADEFIISYVGGFGPHRGLHTAIEGMSNVIQKIPNAKLMLIGPSNKDTRQYLLDLIEKLNLGDSVRIKGSEPFENVIRIMKGSDVNIIPHVSNEHTDSTVPHKLFQILLSGKPLLVSDCAPMKRIVNDYDVGYVFKAGQPTSFSEKIIEMYNEPEKVVEKAERGYRQAYHGDLNWESTSEELIKLYNNLEV